MSNIAAALQIPANTPALDAPTSVTPPGSATDVAAADDFVLALTQALSAAVPPAAAVNVIAPTTPLAADAPSEDEPTAEELAASLASLLSLPVVPPSPVCANDQANALELLGVSGSAAGPGGAQTLTLGTALTQTFATAGTVGTTDLDERRAVSPDSPATPELLLAPAIDKSSQPTSLSAQTLTVAPPLHSSVGTPAWTEELGTRVTVMAERGQHAASLRLSPEHLGPLEIRIAIRDDQASVWFGAAHADTRAAIEHALPRLREMFAAQGMSLTDAGVSREPPRQQPTPRQPASFAESSHETPVTITALQRIGLIDAYA